jgi:putative cardiolipin synthase
MSLLRSLVVIPGLFLVFAGQALAQNQAALLDTDRIALQARVDRLLDPEVREINVSSYIFRPDNVGEGAFATLIKRAREGVKVRILVDKTELMMTPAMLQLARDAGIELREFGSPQALSPLQKLNPVAQFRVRNERMHDKMMIFNDDEVILGGRNLAVNYFLTARDRRPERKFSQFLDRDAYIRGDAGKSAKQYFLDQFYGPKSSVLPLEPSDPAALAKAEKRVSELVAKAESIRGSRDWQQRIKPVESVDFIHDPASGKVRGQGSGPAIIDLLKSAKTSIAIESPYTVLTDEMWAAISEARARGVQVKLYTAASSSSDMKIVGPAFEDDARRLLNLGVEIYQFDQTKAHHIKTICVDGTACYLGSFNMDPRSQNFNTETGVIIRDPNFVAQVDQARDRLHSQFTHRVTMENPFHPPPATFLHKCADLFQTVKSRVARPLLR